MKLKKLDFQDLRENQALQALVQETLISGAVSYAYDRMGDYRNFAQTQGKSFEVFGSWSESGNLLGATQITFDRSYWNGGIKELAYSGDTRVSIQARGRGLADQLIQAACTQPMPVLGAVMGSNTLVLEKKLKDWRKVGIDFQIVGELKALMYLARRSPSKMRVKIATTEDLSRMYSLWERVQSKRNLGRHYSSLEEFQKSYETSGVSLSDTWLVEDVSKNLIGFLSLWDQSAIRAIRVRHLSRSVQVFASLLRPWMKIPGAGEELKVAYAFQTCFDSTHPQVNSALKSLIAAARTRAYEKGFLLFSLGMDARDPLLKAAKGKAILMNSVKLIAANAQLDNRLLHLEVGLG